MRILIMGSGGVGGYYGAMLASAGNDVTFVARGAHLAAIRERGLELRTQGRTIQIRPARATDDPATAGDVELALFTVKTYDTEPAARALAPAVGPDTAVLTLQNGIDSVDTLAGILGPDRILAGVTFVASGVASPGVIAENGFSRQVVIAEPNGGTSERVERIAAVFEAADLDVRVRDDGRQAIWEKFALLAPHASVSAAVGLPIGQIFSVDEAIELYRTLIREFVAVATATGVTLPRDTEEKIIANFKGAPPGQTSSLQRDFAAQRRVELDYLTGTVVRRARQLGIATPGFEALYAVLKTRAIGFGGLN
jgi:2-dehydropantoate 2-reductase